MTAVEWLEDKLTYANGHGMRYNRYHETRDLSEYFEEAKKIEKQEKENYSIQCDSIRYYNEDLD